MKKIIALLLLSIIISASLSGCQGEGQSASAPESQAVSEVVSQAPTPNPATDFEYELKGEKYVYITDYKGESKDVVVPETIEGRRVSVISSIKNKEIESLYLPDSVWTVKSLGECEKLQSVHLGNSLKYIDDYAFANCSSLQSIDIPDTVQMIGDKAFYYCAMLEEIELPDNLRELGNSVFEGCVLLKKVKLPIAFGHFGNSRTEALFQGCTALEEVIFEEGIERIEGYLPFNVCYSLKELTIPASVEAVSDTLFYAKYLEKVTFKGNCPDVPYYSATKLFPGEAPESGKLIEIYYDPATEGWGDDCIFRKFPNHCTLIPVE